MSLSGLSTTSLSAMFDSVSDALVAFDRDDTVQFCNRAAMRLLAVEPGFTLRQLEPALGEATFVALRRARAGQPSALAAMQTLHGGQLATLVLTALGQGAWLLTLKAGGFASPLAGLTSVAPLGHAAAKTLPGRSRPGTAKAAPSAKPPVAHEASREMLRLFWDSPFPTLVQDAEFRITAANAAMVVFTGLGRDQLIGQDLLTFQPPEDLVANQALREHVRLHPQDERALAEVRQRLIDSAGRERWFRAVHRVLTGDAGEPLYLSVLQDATSEHVAREQADRSLRELDQWFDLSPVGMVLYDDVGLLVRTNAAFEDLLGEIPVTLGQSSAELQHLLAWDEGAPALALSPGAVPLERHASILNASGAPCHLRALVRGFATGTGQRRYMAVVEDRNAEDERDLARLEMGALMDTASIGVATYDQTRGWMPASAPARSGRGKARSAGLQSINRDIVEPESLPEYERLQRALRQAERAEVRYAVRHPELGRRWVLTRVEPGQLAGGRPTVSVVTLDVTEQEEARHRNEQLLREFSFILDSTSAGIAYVRGATLLRCNRRFARMLGLPEPVRLGLQLEELFSGDEPVYRVLHDSLVALRTSAVFETEFCLQQPATDMAPASEIWYALSVRRASPLSISADGRPVEPLSGLPDEPEAVAVLSDITRLKTQQSELESLVRDRELMFSLSEVGIAYVRDGHIERANEAVSALTGYSAAELRGLDYARLYESAEVFTDVFGREELALHHHGRSTVERRLRRRDGKPIWVQCSLRRVDDADASAGIICSFVNVDDRHRARQSLVHQAARTRSVLDSVLVGIVTLGDGGIEWLNRSARRMFSGELADFVGEPISTIATPELDHPLRQMSYMDGLQEGQNHTFECRLQARDGRTFWVVGNAVVTSSEVTGRQITIALLDIEQRRQAEMRVAQAQASLQRIIETAPLAIALFDAQSLDILQLNHMAAMFAGHEIGDAIGRSPEQWLGGGDAAQIERDMRRALQSQEVTRCEYRRGLSGDERIWDARYVPLITPQGGAEQLLLVASDVTEQRVMEKARFDAAIAQRDMLVKEVHHRIKNNLQGVAGLLQLSSQRNPQVATIIGEAVSQVQAIAQVYGLQVGVAGPLRVKNVVEAITGSLQRMFGRAITVVVQGPVPLQWALAEVDSIPIALTINELITNAIKHSPQGSEVRCTVSCELDKVQVLIANLAQLPERFNLAQVPSGVSGLGLVRSLLPRRFAKLTIEQQGDWVVAGVELVPPGVTALELIRE